MKQISFFAVTFLLLTTMADAAIVTMTCQANDGRTRYTSTVVEQGGCESSTFAAAKKACFEKLTDKSMYSLVDYSVKSVEVNGDFDKVCCK
jgi:hypothetical protein